MTPLARLPLDDPRWLDAVHRDPDATPFHHPAWAATIADAYGYEPFVLALLHGNAIAAAAPAVAVHTPFRAERWVSLPFTDEVRPLGDAAALAAAVRGNPRVTFHGALDATAVPCGFVHELALTHDPDETRRCLSAMVRRNVARGERSRLEVRRAASAADLVHDYYLLHRATRRRLGMPTQPRRFFELVWQRLCERGLAYALLAYDGAEPVAGAVFLAWGRTVVFKYGASTPESWPLRPNNLLLWRAIETACTEGRARFDFGRTDLGDDGLRRFKAGWGTCERTLAYTHVDAAAGTARLRVLRPLIRRAPAVVSEAVGSLLYRYAA